MTAVLFLDLDGVVNTQPFLVAVSVVKARIMGADFDPSDMIDPVHVERLNRILGGLNVWVVLSSSWRCGWELHEVEGYLKAKGFAFALHDKTPDGAHGDDGHRHHEIRRYLETNSQIDQDRLCIIDDGADAGVGREHQFVHTSLSYGLEEKHVELARRMLQGRPE